ncbi:MAG: M48 family metallopeptidase [Bryobacteraceae bacterium]|jgi:Zn-dependent protease with chaperone function
MTRAKRALVSVSFLSTLVLLFALPPLLRAQQPSQPAVPSAPPQTLAAPSYPGGVITEYSPGKEAYQKAVAYSSAHELHLFVDALYGLLILVLVLSWRLAPKYRDWAERVSARRFVQVLIYAPALLVTVAVLGLPSDAWDHSLDRRFGLSVQGWRSWLGDWITGQVVMLVVGALLVWILYGVIRRSPRRWWLYFWMASIPVLLALFFLQPLVIDPLFFTFKPLAASQPELTAAIERVVHHGGMDIPRSRMFEMNASSKMTGLNAYVTGFGSSKRAVIWDTTIQKATTPEVLFVFGHEMGHYVLHHVPKEIAIDAVILLVLIFLGARISTRMLARWGKRWAIRGLDDWASLPLLLLVLSGLAFLATPAFNAVSRHFEHEADRYGLEVIHGIVPDAGQVAAHYFEKSGEINLADPKPSSFDKFWMWDHPTRPERVHFVATYDPWSHGETPKYVH